MVKSVHSKILKNLLLLPLFLLLLALIFIAWLDSDGATDVRSDIKEFFLKELVHVYPLPPGQVVDAAYILGGPQDSLKLKFLLVAELYKNGAIDKVWLPSRTGLTEYNSQTDRNMTNDEWSILELHKLRVPPDKIEIIKIGEGLFGTWLEARHISELVRLRKTETFLLIAQPYHSQRVYMSFKKFLPKNNLKFYIQSSSESSRFIEVAIELFKLKVYEHLLLPLS